MNKKKICFALLAVAAVQLCEVRNANAYFTTYVTAKGGYEVSWRHQEEIHEEVKDFKKYVSISSKEDSIPVYVRARAFAGSTYSLTYSGDGWEYNETDGYYYYKEPLKGGETTSVLLVSIDQIPINPQDGENFNVIVIYESLPVQYDEDGNMIAPKDADWTQTITSSQETISTGNQGNDETGGEEVSVLALPEGGSDHE